jgi:penicillin amidase
VIGFNQNIAWGVTNAGRDVRNWYEVQFTDASRTHYILDSQEIASTLRIETIHVKGKGTILDTVIETQFGPIIYDKKFSQSPMPTDLALSWTNYLASNELKTFLGLNKAKNHQDYLQALESFYCPGQNFIYADVSGNVAIKQQGLFPKTPVDKDKFVLKGHSSLQMMDQFIPINENPYVLNPERGFVSSANQHPTDNNYPYYYSSGDFEAYRNRRVNEVLASKTKHSIQDMKNLQGDNLGLMAKEFLPVFLQMLSPSNLQNPTIKELETWDFFYNEDSKMATFFDIWMKNFEEMVWDELKSEKVVYDFPKSIVLYHILKSEPQFVFFDNKSTSAIETAQDIVNQSFEKSVQDYQKNKQAWWEYKDTEIPHLAKIPAFGRYHVPTGGNKHIVNATWKDWAPSWRMIVEMKPNRPEAWVCFPGGQSGSPASKFYDNQINSWAKIGYRKVVFSFKPSELSILKSIYFHKK